MDEADEVLRELLTGASIHSCNLHLDSCSLQLDREMALLASGSSHQLRKASIEQVVWIVAVKSLLQQIRGRFDGGTV